MPVYNSGKYLKTAVESILSQSLTDFELILVDDGSTDGSSEVCDKYASKDSRVVVIHQSNGGICNARNKGLEIAKGEYIAFCDHDDEYLPGLLEENYQKAKESGADIVKFGSHWELKRGDNVYNSYNHIFWNDFYTTSQVKANFWMLFRKFLFNLVWDGLFKHSFIYTNELKFDTSFKTGGEDNDFLWKCVGAGASFQLNSKIFYKHYVRTGVSTSATYKDASVQMIIDRPKQLLNDIALLGFNLEDYQVDFAAFWLERVLGSLCNVLSSPTCPLNVAKKVEILKSLREQSYFYKWILTVSPRKIVKIAPKQYALLQQLYKYKLYGLCLKIYQIRNKK